jgi:protein TonB
MNARSQVGEDELGATGPLKLQQAALDAVRQRIYRPYLLNGEAVEVGTTANMVFSISR